MKPGVDALQGLPLLANCTPAMLARLNAVADLAGLVADEVLFRQGDQVNELNILTAGYAVKRSCSRMAMTRLSMSSNQSHRSGYLLHCSEAPHRWAVGP